MDTETIIKSVGVLAALLGLLLTAAKQRRDARSEARKTVIDGLEVLKKLRPGSYHYENVEANLRRHLFVAYPPRRIHNMVMAVTGLLMYFGLALYGLYLGAEGNGWSIAAFLGAVVGFEFQRRSLFPDGATDIPGVEVYQERPTRRWSRRG